MKINIYHESNIYSTTIKNPTSVRDIIINLKKTIKQNTNNFLLLNEKNNVLPETELISPKEKTTQNYFLINSSNYLKEDEKEEPIEDYIMKVTGAKTKLEKKKLINENNRIHLFEQLPNGGNLGRLLEMIQFLEDRNMIVQIRNNQPENNNIEANENLVNQLKDMGFPEDRARDALIRSRNELSIATDILLGEGGVI